MRLVPYDKSKIRSKYFAVTVNQQILDEFVNSGLECAKVEGWTNASPGSAANSLNTSIKRFKYGGIKAVSYNKEVYLVKTT